VEADVFVIGMDRSGTSTATRLVSLLGLHTPAGDDLIQARETNPRGVWESRSLVAFNRRVLATAGSDERFPVPLAPGWENDTSLEQLHAEAPRAVRRAFPVAPWVSKDPLHCLTFAFWRRALDVQPVVVLMHRNPLETAGSARRAWGRDAIYGLALWERYLREALSQLGGVPVLVTNYEQLIVDPVGWSRQAHAFFRDAGVAVGAVDEQAARSFVDPRLRHVRFTREDVARAHEVSAQQRALFDALVALEGAHERFSPPELVEETATTEALITERRNAFALKSELESKLAAARGSDVLARLRRSRYAGPARRLRDGGRQVLERRRAQRSPSGETPPRTDGRPPLHVLHIGKTGGTALKHVLHEYEDRTSHRLLFRGHEAKLADVPPGEQLMFFLRDPLGRFVSAFNGRLREDRPRYHYPWREEERAAFAVFRTPDELATALSSADERVREQAERAMHGIGHVNTPYTFWFPDEAAFLARVRDVFFVGFQDRMDEDFDLLKAKLGLPADRELPRDAETAHRTPDEYERSLSELGRANLERWYARDIEFVALCRALAPLVLRS
jgi:hypothetical protein